MLSFTSGESAAAVILGPEVGDAAALAEFSRGITGALGGGAAAGGTVVVAVLGIAGVVDGGASGTAWAG